MASSLSYSVGGTHTHTAYLPNLGILLAPPLIFTKYIAFILFNSRVYRSHSTVQRTKYCLVGGIHNPVRWKKEVDAQHLLHDMKSNCRRRRRLLYYTPLFSLMLEVQISPMERARVLDFSLCFNFGFHVFCFYFFLFLPVVFWLAFSGQNFPYLYSPLFRIKD